MNKIIKRAYKFRFYPQKDLVILLAKTFGCVRFVYNQTLKFSEEHFLTKLTDVNYKSLSGTDRINYIKTLKSNPEYSWLKEVSSIALQQSVMHLNTSYDRFFKAKSGKPQFKKKMNKNSFTITGKNSLHFDKDFTTNKKFYLPKYNKPLNIKFSREFDHLAVSSVNISQEPSGKYFISFLTEENLAVKKVKNQSNNPKQKVSYDLGLKTTAKIFDGNVDSNGNNIFYDFNLPELIQAVDKKLRKAQRIMSRKQKGSNNRNKQRIKLARLHEKKNNILNYSYHKLSTRLINENQVIIREDLAVNNMLKNRKLSRRVHSVAWSKFNRMIEYKADWHNREIIEANRFYPSSKTCSCCGHINHSLSLKDRQWICISCNANHDRDENACLNLYNYKNATAGTAVNACGGNVRPNSLKLNSTKKKRAVSNEAGILCL